MHPRTLFEFEGDEFRAGRRLFLKLACQLWKAVIFQIDLVLDDKLPCSPQP